MAAVRFGVEGLRNGEPVITMEHVNRLTSAAAPHWPSPPDGRPGVHRVVVRGNPGVEINTHLGLDGVDHNQGGVISTAARAVNAIHDVCAAPPGLMAVKDLPADPCRHCDVVKALAPKIAPRRPAGGSQVRAERTRERVLDETVRCVIDEGFAAASAKHIAERAGVTWGVVQYHFGDRDGLLMAVVDRGLAELTRVCCGRCPRRRSRSPATNGCAGWSTPPGRCSPATILALRWKS